MHRKTIVKMRMNIMEHSDYQVIRYLDPGVINLPKGYQVEVFAYGLDAPSCMAFNEDGDLYVAESGYISKKPVILRLRENQFESCAEGFISPVTGISLHDKHIYISHRGKVTVIKPEGTKVDIISGLPSQGDHWNSNVAIGKDDKLYFGLGTATNSGVVGTDNTWAFNYPNLCDNPGSYVILKGQNYETSNMFTIKKEETETGAFTPYGVRNLQYEVKKGLMKAAGSILRANLDGTDLEQIAWGVRFITCMRFDKDNRLFAANQGFDIRGSRPIANAPDELLLIEPGKWYGWPDYAGGEPVTSTKFRPDGSVQPDLLILNHPGVPPAPFALFQPDSYIVGFDFCYNYKFGPYGDIYIAEFGMGGRITDNEITPYASKGHRISRIDMSNGTISTFAMNKSGFSASLRNDGGFSRPVDVHFGPDGAMYVLDMGINAADNPSRFYPNTGVIWKITRTA